MWPQCPVCGGARTVSDAELQALGVSPSAPSLMPVFPAQPLCLLPLTSTSGAVTLDGGLPLMLPAMPAGAGAGVMVAAQPPQQMCVVMYPIEQCEMGVMPGLTLPPAPVLAPPLAPALADVMVVGAPTPVPMPVMAAAEPVAVVVHSVEPQTGAAVLVQLPAESQQKVNALLTDLTTSSTTTAAAAAADTTTNPSNESLPGAAAPNSPPNAGVASSQAAPPSAEPAVVVVEAVVPSTAAAPAASEVAVAPAAAAPQS
jgi:hypothetical protein